LMLGNLKPIAEDYATELLGRPVTLESLTVKWGDPLSIEAAGLKVANADWATAPNFASVEHISALLDPWSLLGGALKFPKMRLMKPVVVLERGEGEDRNWRSGKAAPITPGEIVVVPRYRSQFPSLPDFEMTDAQVIYKSKTYNMQLDLHDVAIHAADDHSGASVAASGKYNGTPVLLTADTDSFTAMRDASKPFGVNLILRAAGSEIDFQGGMRDPLGFEGVEGPLTLNAQKLGDLMKLFGTDIGIDPPFAIAGAFKHGGNHWEIKQSKGKIATSAFTGDLLFEEAPRGKPDNLTAVLHFDNLAIPPIIASAPKSGKAPADFMTTSLAVDQNRGTNIDLTLDAGQLVLGKGRIADFGVTAKIVSGQITLSRLTMAFAGGRIDGSGSATAVAGGSHIIQRGTIVGADAAQLALYVPALVGKLTGRIDGGFDVDRAGDTLGHALKASHGHAVLGMANGSIARDLMEKLSTNLLNLFRGGEGAVPVACLLAVADFRNGAAQISPIRLRSNAGTLIGRGQVDFLGHTLDITIQSESATTGFFSLDIPIRISGNFANPTIDPHFGSAAATRQALANSNPAQGLSGELKGFVDRSACRR
ncbi:MAG TPA: AsmA-like C-terminal region-containing protein, partial [Dongiaceae bacterium]|nr:AsmA-like C-terminal region-containing protein [Dongiaceae bacterium]